MAVGNIEPEASVQVHAEFVLHTWQSRARRRSWRQRSRTRSGGGSVGENEASQLMDELQSRESQERESQEREINLHFNPKRET